MTSKYKLPAGTQVREEDFGLLFYTRKGPRLYFLPSGNLLRCDFFHGNKTLAQGLQEGAGGMQISAGRLRSLQNALVGLRDKGVIIEF